jgi:hypothetical protein
MVAAKPMEMKEVVIDRNVTIEKTNSTVWKVFFEKKKA